MAHNVGMLRDLSLIPLSRQHHAALALCVSIERELKQPAPDMEPWRREVERIFAEEIRYHFEAEERFVFPLAEPFAQLQPLLEDLRRDHARLRDFEARVLSLRAEEFGELSRVLSGHIRKEERELFERMQELLPAEELGGMGQRIAEFFRSSGMPPEACGLDQGRPPRP
jgi:hemerythrin-like domain-containing protein